MSTNMQQSFELSDLEPTYSHVSNASCEPRDAWVLSTKLEGTRIAGWRVSKILNKQIKILDSSERCPVTGFCYPIGAKLVRAQLLKN